ncbi:Uncharacterised protein [Segatella copri]|nr:Uncharacterised protein [Segatella copri]
MGLDVHLDNLIDNKKHNHHCRDEPSVFNFTCFLHLLLFSSLLRSYTQSGMRYSTQTLLRNQLTCFAVNTIGLVLDTNQSCFQSLDELLLTLGHLDDFFLALCFTTLLKSLVGW